MESWVKFEKERGHTWKISSHLAKGLYFGNWVTLENISNTWNIEGHTWTFSFTLFVSSFGPKKAPLGGVVN